MNGASRTAALVAASIALLARPEIVAACSVCFGDPDSPIVRSAEMGVWFLLGVIFVVQAAFGIFFLIYFRRRARMVRDPLPRPPLRLVKKEA